MNEIYTRQFAHQALQAGIPQEKIAALLNKADQIAQRSQRSTKTAATKFDFVDSLLVTAGLQKTASSVAYTQGLLSEAFTAGANVPQAYNFAKQALEATNVKLAFMQKIANINNSPALSKYAEGFLTSAKQAGVSDDEALSLLVNVIDREKRAGDDSMFKGAPSGPPPPGMPPGGPGGDPTGGAGGPPPGADPMSGPGAQVGGPGGSEEQQLLQLLESLPPEEQQKLIQELLATMGGGQGGPGGDPSQGAPGGAPPHHHHAGGGMPPQGPPQ